MVALVDPTFVLMSVDPDRTKCPSSHSPAGKENQARLAATA